MKFSITIDIPERLMPFVYEWKKVTQFPSAKKSVEMLLGFGLELFSALNASAKQLDECSKEKTDKDFIMIKNSYIQLHGLAVAAAVCDRMLPPSNFFKTMPYVEEFLNKHYLDIYPEFKNVH